MTHIFGRIVLSLHALLSLAALTHAAAGPDDGNWPSFRGPGASGVAEGHTTPTTWDVAKRENLRWKSPVPGLGHSSPVIWGDRIFLTAAIGERGTAELKVGLYGDIQPVDEDFPHKFIVLCLDKRTGAILWQQTAHEGVPKIKRHTKATHANPTAATDGEHVVAFFGSEGLYCYDMDGKLLWKKDFGVLDAGFYMVPQAQWGFGSSPVIFEGKVIVQCDVQRDSFLAAFDVRDGRELWRTPRDDVPTWSTPAAHRGPGRAQVIVNGMRHIGGYDLVSGKELWVLEGGGDIPVPTPVVARDLVYITNAHGAMAPIYAVRLSASDDVTPASEEHPGEHVAWWTSRKGNYMQTPLVYGDNLYMCMDNGVLTCLDARTGGQHFRKRLGSGQTGFTASGVAAEGKLYFTSEEGDVYVLKAGTAFEQLAVNPLGEVCMATPAISAGVLYFRTQGHLLAIGAEAK
ncbi:MAG: PQQ-binding-like beta-propeller repeat protein [Phycisphaerae bacterium]|jgi:outer membrane protein assembly factor BamB